MTKQPQHPHEQPGSQTEAEASAAEGIAQTAPVGWVWVPGLETVILQGLGKVGSDLLGKGAQTGISGLNEYIKREGPLTNIILASWSDGGLYHVAIKIVNLIADAIYIEELWVEKPVNIAFVVCPIDDDILGEFSKGDSYFPIRVPPQDTKSFAIRLTDDSSGSLKKSGVAELSYNYTLLSGAGVGTTPKKNVKISLRAKGPPYAPRRRVSLSKS